MTNQEATIYLHTPLVESEGREKFSDGITRVKAKVMAAESSGLLVQVKSLGNEKGWHSGPLILKKIFIPYHKIDFVSFE